MRAITDQIISFIVGMLANFLMVALILSVVAPEIGVTLTDSSALSILKITLILFAFKLLVGLIIVLPWTYFMKSKEASASRPRKDFAVIDNLFGKLAGSIFVSTAAGYFVIVVMADKMPADITIQDPLSAVALAVAIALGQSLIATMISIRVYTQTLRSMFGPGREHEKQWRILRTKAEINFRSGDYEKAQKFTESALVEASRLGDDDFRIAATIRDLARVFAKRRMYVDLEKLYIDNPANPLELALAKDRDTASMGCCVATKYKITGNLDGAETLFKNVLGLQADNESRLFSLSSMAKISKQKGDLERAKDLLTQAAVLTDGVDDDKLLADYLETHATVCAESGDEEKAALLLNELSAIRDSAESSSEDV